MEFDQFTNPTTGDLKLDDSITHVVIQLSEVEFREKLIRLVPRLWIDKVHGKWVCLYPQKKDSALVEEWVKNSLPPRADFNRYEVEILIKTTNFEEGERILSELTNIENGENSSNSFANESTQARKRPRISEDFHVKDEDEVLYTEDNSVYIVHSPLRVTPDFTQSRSRKESAEKLEKNSNESTEEYFEKRLKVIEDRIMSKLESMNRSIIYHVNKKVDEILNAVSSNTETAILETPDTNNSMGIKLPVEDIKQFSQLSQTIKQDNEKEKSMKVFLYRAQRGSNNLKTSLSKMLGSTMTKAVQLKFSGQGRKVKGKGKENFSATPLFSCIDDVLSNIFPHIGKAEILSATTKWFSGAADREGGKKLRSMDAQVLPKTEPIE